MNVRRGDVVLVLYPFAAGMGGPRRQALIVQNDADNVRLHNTIVAQITTNLRRVAESTHVLLVQTTTFVAEDTLIALLKREGLLQ